MRLLLVISMAGFLVWRTVGASDPPEAEDQAPTILTIVGAAGEAEYGETFERWAGFWNKASLTGGAHFRTIGLDPTGATNDVDLVQSALREEPKNTTREFWLIMLGHGTFDGKEAKFNLRGPDLSVSNLITWLEPFHRPLVLINTTAASSPFLNKLSAPGRVIITATKSGYEQNYARFADYFSRAVSDLNADLDKDGQVSVLEAFLMAGHGVNEFYKTEGRLATEHPLIDDNGDGLGTPPDWFRGVRAIKKPAQGSSVDGLRAHQIHLLRSENERKLSPALRTRRNELELQINQLRDAKETYSAEEYYGKLEVLLLDLARLYENSDGTQRVP